MNDLKDIVEIIDDLEKEKDELKAEVIKLRMELEENKNKFDGQSYAILNFIRTNPDVSISIDTDKVKLYGPNRSIDPFTTRQRFYLRSSYTGNQLEVKYG